jgi:NAD(P)-dependent dehydrogenase (short-subunit alcohol dehydrogenase family)
MLLNEKVALVTGGTKGIGLGIAEALIKSGIRTAITGRNSETVYSAAAHLNAQWPGMALGLVSDVRSYESEVNTIHQIIAHWGRLDILIANAGLGHFGSIENISHTQWNETIDINLTGVFNSVKASVEEIKKNQGYIFTIASLAGTNFFKGGTAYNASKFGLVGFTQALMLDLREHGVKVSTIMPGSVTSYFAGHVPDENDGWKIQPEDIGQLVVDLLKMNPRALPSKIEIRPTQPPK